MHIEFASVASGLLVGASYSFVRMIELLAAQQKRGIAFSCACGLAPILLHAKFRDN